MKKKRTNPRRIPFAKSRIDSNAILEEATKDDMYRAWLLVGNAIHELDLIPGAELPHLADSVNRYIGSSANDREKAAEMRRAERMMGIPQPYKSLDPSGIRSEVELESFKKKVYRLATFTALCVLYLALEKSGRFDADQMRRLFLNVNLALAEIENGMNSYARLEKELGEFLLLIPSDS